MTDRIRRTLSALFNGTIFTKEQEQITQAEITHEHELLMCANLSLCKYLKFYETKRYGLDKDTFEKIFKNHNGNAQILIRNGFEYDTMAQFLHTQLTKDETYRCNFILHVPHKHSTVWIRKIK